MDELYMSGYDWADRYGLRVVDPRGWRDAHRFFVHGVPEDLRYASLLDHICEREFWLRLSVSTADGMTDKARQKLEEVAGGAGWVLLPSVPYNGAQSLAEGLRDGDLVRVRGAKLEPVTALSKLIEKWEADLDTYPIEQDIPEAKYAHKTLELCLKELKEALED